MPSPTTPPSSRARIRTAPPELPVLAVALALALAAAVSLGLARFSYALLLPPMRADLGWSYLTAGAMNTVNAAGYLVGALLMPAVLRRCGARAVLLGGGWAAGALLIAHGLVVADAALYALRGLTGVASAATFVAGGLLAARLSSRPAARATSLATPLAAPPASSPARSTPSAGLVLGVYYGGAGLGIVVAALLVPPLSAQPGAHAWQWAWIALGAVALAATTLTGRATRVLDPHAAAGPAARTASAPSAPSAPALAARFEAQHFAFGLVAYFLFGLGYIGYMTFVVTLLHEQQLGSGLITAFYAVLGGAVIGSSWVWAGLLQRQRGGGALAVLNALLALATVLPVLSRHPLAVFASGLLFGGVFLSVVASTTALVRHNLAPAAWPVGISAFTIVFAAGQIVGPTLVGWVADGPGGLRTGLAGSAAVLALGALIAARQKALAPTEPH